MADVTPEQMAQFEQMKKSLMGKILDKAAAERLGRVRVANPTLAMQLELYLMQLYQAGQLKETITDEKLKQILNALTENKKETRIMRR